MKEDIKFINEVNEEVKKEIESLFPTGGTTQTYVTLVIDERNHS